MTFKDITFDELKLEFFKMKEEIKSLKAENKELKARLKIYENSNTPSSKKRNKKQTNEPKKSSGREVGHIGSGKVYLKPTHTQNFSSSCCPNCFCSQIKKIDETIIINEEISSPKPVKVIKNIIYNFKCNNCERKFESKNDVLKKSRFGINVISEILISKFEERLPLVKIKNKLIRQYNLKISTSGINGIICRVSNHLNNVYLKLLNKINEMRFVYADETSWRVSGKNYWLWSFSNKLISVFMLRKSRGRKPVKEILNNYNGVIISDGWKVYEKFCKSQQRCWAHLIREVKELNYFVEGRNLITNLDNLFYLAKKASKLNNYNERKEKYDFLLCEMKTLIGFCMSNKKLRKIGKTINNGLNSWFTAVLENDIEFTNNRAEREIRESVVIRKIIGGFHSEKGTKSFDIIMTLFATFKKQNKNLFYSLKKLLTKEQFRIGL